MAEVNALNRKALALEAVEQIIHDGGITSEIVRAIVPGGARAAVLLVGLLTGKTWVRRQGLRIAGLDQAAGQFRRQAEAGIARPGARPAIRPAVRPAARSGRLPGAWRQLWRRRVELGYAGVLHIGPHGSPEHGDVAPLIGPRQFQPGERAVDEAGIERQILFETVAQGFGLVILARGLQLQGQALERGAPGHAAKQADGFARQITAEIRFATNTAAVGAAAEGRGEAGQRVLHVAAGG